MTIDSGPLEGMDSDRAASWKYLGIPYAVPPLGELHWRAPRPVEPWSETRPAQALADFCPQFLYFTNEYAGNEGCLYLNVYRPRTQERDLPVLVWYHGGGNNNGDTGQEFPVYDGARLADRSNFARSSDPNGNSLPIWEPWSNSAGGFRAVTLDVSYADDIPRARDPAVYTEESVYQDARANLEGDILAEVLRRLDDWFGYTD